jgi:pimeloyl-ACP methyl ester carboxylesterase
MDVAEYYPYRSAEARNLCCQHLDQSAVKRWPIPLEERVVPTAFGSTYVRSGGPAGAPALFLLHGAGATSLMWAPNVESLSTVYRIMAIDQIGEFGKSVCSRPPESFDDLARWLDELIQATEGRKRVSLAGLSYGGALAVQYAMRYPERLDALILLAPGGTILRPPVEFWLRLALLAILREKGLKAFFRWVFADMALSDTKWIDSTVEELALNMRCVQRHRVPMPKVLTDIEWNNLRVPTLVLTGENEVIYRPQNALQHLQRVAPRVIAEMIPGAGHDLSFVQATVVNERMLRFLNEARVPSRPLATGTSCPE